MIDVKDVYILKSGLFSGYLGLPQSAKCKFLVKRGKEFYDLEGQRVFLFKSSKVIGALTGHFEVCDYLGEERIVRTY